MLKRTAYDVDTIAAAMLDDAKVQCRIDFADDDAFVTQLITRSIGLIERTTGFYVATSSWQWSPGGAAGGNGFGGEGSNRCTCCLPGFSDQSGWQIPVCPATIATALVTPSDGGADIDVASMLDVAGVIDPSQFQRQWLIVKSGSSLPPGTLLVTLAAGYSMATDSTMPPSIADIVLRLTAYLYETREFANLPGFDAEHYAASMTAGLWVPAC